MAWKKDHARKLEERRDYFRPQVLRIEDEETTPGLTAFSYCSEDECEDGNGNAEVCGRGGAFERAKSAFKQSFDYEVACGEVKRSGEEVHERLATGRLWCCLLFIGKSSCVHLI